MHAIRRVSKSPAPVSLVIACAAFCAIPLLAQEPAEEAAPQET